MLGDQFPEGNPSLRGCLRSALLIGQAEPDPGFVIHGLPSPIAQGFQPLVGLVEADLVLLNFQGGGPE
jgi:hypothetical protein